MIVIAVIGALTAILVPVFINLTPRANEASDQALVRNLNTSLTLEELEDRDTKNITYNDVLGDLSYYGYTEDDLFTKSNTSLLWYQEDNRFHLSNKIDTNIDEELYWELVNDINTNHYSKCLRSTSTFTSFTDVSYSLDVGRKSDISSISYSNSSNPDVVTYIRTNGGEDNYITDMDVNGNLSTYYHYGNLKSLYITSCKEYREFGKVRDNYLTIKEGKVVITSESNIERVVVASGSGDVTIEYYKDIDIEVPLGEESRISTISHIEEETYIYNGYIYDQASMLEACTRGGRYLVSSNFSFDHTDSFVIANDKEVNIDLNGHTITQSNDNNKYVFRNFGHLDLMDRAGDGVIISKKGIVSNQGSGVTRIHNGRYEATKVGVENEGATLFQAWDGELIIDDGVFTSNLFLVYGNTGAITVNGGTFSNSTVQAFYLYQASTLIVNDCNVNSTGGFVYAGSDSRAAINGGAYYQHVSGDDTNYCSLVLDFEAQGIDSGYPIIDVNGGDFTLRSTERYFIKVWQANNNTGTSAVFLDNCNIHLYQEDGSDRASSNERFAIHQDSTSHNNVIIGSGVTCNVEMVIE